VPRALLAGRQVIRVFDPTVHEEVGVSDAEPLWDDRWSVAAGLRSSSRRAHLGRPGAARPTGPAAARRRRCSVKASGGVLVIDDLGRQRAETVALLNRWIAPLETGFDSLVAATGHPVRVPLDAFVVYRDQPRRRLRSPTMPSSAAWPTRSRSRAPTWPGTPRSSGR